MSKIPLRVLGKTGLEVSALGLGCASLWARRGFSEARAAAVFEQALALGVNFFDTGPAYAGGHAEWRLGRLLKAVGGEADKLLVASKFGTRADSAGRLVRDFSARSVAASLDDTLERLGLERIALLQLHGPAPEELTDELYAALEREKKRGRVGLLGVNAHSHEVLESAAGNGLFDVIMPFVSVLRPEGAGLACRVARQGTGVIAAEPLARMRFALPVGRWLTRPGGWWYVLRALRAGPNELLRARRIGRALQAPGWTPAQLALRWTLDRPGVACAVVGTTQPAHVRQLAGVFGRTMPAAVDEQLSGLLGA